MDFLFHEDSPCFFVQVSMVIKIFRTKKKLMVHVFALQIID